MTEHFSIARAMVAGWREKDSEPTGDCDNAIFTRAMNSLSSVIPQFLAFFRIFSIFSFRIPHGVLLDGGLELKAGGGFKADRRL